MNTTQKVREFIRSHIVNIEDNVRINTGDNIFELGFLDSMFALQLVNFIEEEWAVEVTDEDLDIDNFSTIDRIVGFISKKKEAANG
jgi:acyl carrier protein